MNAEEWVAKQAWDKAAQIRKALAFIGEMVAMNQDHFQRTALLVSIARHNVAAHGHATRACHMSSGLTTPDQRAGLEAVASSLREGRL